MLGEPMRGRWMGVGLGLMMALLLALSACSKATPGVPAQRQVVITYERSGGIAGISERWLIYSDGSIVSAEGRGGQVSAEKVKALLARIETAGFFTWQESYQPANPCCDRMTQVLTVTLGGKTHRVQVLDGTEGVPEALFPLLDEVNALIREATGG